MASQDIKNLLILAERYGSNKAIALSTVSLYAAGQGRLMERLRAGCGITVGRRNRILQWFSDHWPAGLVWPEEISRPSPASPAEAGAGCRGAAADNERRRAFSPRAPSSSRRRPVEAPAIEIPARYP